MAKRQGNHFKCNHVPLLTVWAQGIPEEGLSWENTFVIASDDDHEWRDYAVSTLLAHAIDHEAKRHSGDRKRAWSYYSYRFPFDVRKLLEPPPESKESRANELSESIDLSKRDLFDAICVGQGGDLLGTWGEALMHLTDWADDLLEPSGRTTSCFYVDDLFFSAFLMNHSVETRPHPWTPQLHKRMKDDGEQPNCKRACSPVQLRMRYSDALAMGEHRENHNMNCMHQLMQLDRWPRKKHPHSAPQKNVCLE